jgi:hypothetical protein
VVHQQQYRSGALVGHVQGSSFYQSKVWLHASQGVAVGERSFAPVGVVVLLQLVLLT